MPDLERCLRELESATAALAAVPVDDFAEAQAALDRRAWAIGDLAALAQRALSEPERQNALDRLLEARAAGEEAAQRLTTARCNAALEWSHWARIYRTLGASLPAIPGHVDFRG